MAFSSSPTNLPDYEQLVKFLLKPFLSPTETLAVNCEYTLERNRVWLRIAIASGDQSNAFGRGGRNIQAIRTVLQAAATGVGQSIHLDVYGSNSGSRQEESERLEEQRVSENRPPRIAPTRRQSGGGDRERGGNDSAGASPIRPRR